MIYTSTTASYSRADGGYTTSIKGTMRYGSWWNESSTIESDYTGTYTISGEALPFATSSDSNGGDLLYTGLLSGTDGSIKYTFTSVNFNRGATSIGIGDTMIRDGVAVVVSATYDGGANYTLDTSSVNPPALEDLVEGVDYSTGATSSTTSYAIYQLFSITNDNWFETANSSYNIISCTSEDDVAKVYSTGLTYNSSIIPIAKQVTDKVTFFNVSGVASSMSGTEDNVSKAFTTVDVNNSITTRATSYGSATITSYGYFTLYANNYDSLYLDYEMDNNEVTATEASLSLSTLRSAMEILSSSTSNGATSEYGMYSSDGYSRSRSVIREELSTYIRATNTSNATIWRDEIAYETGQTNGGAIKTSTYTYYTEVSVLHSYVPTVDQDKEQTYISTSVNGKYTYRTNFTFKGNAFTTSRDWATTTSWDPGYSSADTLFPVRITDTNYTYLKAFQTLEFFGSDLYPFGSQTQQPQEHISIIGDTLISTREIATTVYTTKEPIPVDISNYEDGVDFGVATKSTRSTYSEATLLGGVGRFCFAGKQTLTTWLNKAKLSDKVTTTNYTATEGAYLSTTYLSDYTSSLSETESGCGVVTEAGGTVTSMTKSSANTYSSITVRGTISMTVEPYVNKKTLSTSSSITTSTIRTYYESSFSSYATSNNRVYLIENGIPVYYSSNVTFAREVRTTFRDSISSTVEQTAKDFRCTSRETLATYQGNQNTTKYHTVISSSTKAITTESASGYINSYTTSAVVEVSTVEATLKPSARSFSSSETIYSTRSATNYNLDIYRTSISTSWSKAAPVTQSSIAKIITYTTSDYRVGTNGYVVGESSYTSIYGSTTMMSKTRYFISETDDKPQLILTSSTNFVSSSTLESASTYSILRNSSSSSSSTISVTSILDGDDRVISGSFFSTQTLRGLITADSFFSESSTNMYNEASSSWTYSSHQTYQGEEYTTRVTNPYTTTSLAGNTMYTYTLLDIGGNWTSWVASSSGLLTTSSSSSSEIKSITSSGVDMLYSSSGIINQYETVGNSINNYISTITTSYYRNRDGTTVTYYSETMSTIGSMTSVYTESRTSFTSNEDRYSSTRMATSVEVVTTSSMPVITSNGIFVTRSV